MDKESPTDTPSVPRSLLANALEQTVKIASLIGIGLYVIGLLVFNVFLAKYGITDFAALKPQCLFTGAWALSLLILAALPVVVFDSIFATKTRTTFIRILLGTGLAIATTYFVTVMIHVLFSIFIGGPVYAESNYWALDPGVPGWRSLLLVMVTLGIGTSIVHRKTSERPTRWYLVTASSLITPSILGLLIIGHETCESVNPEVGGGKPLSATLYFGRDGQQLLNFMRANAAPFHDDEPDNVIKSELLYATNDRYVARIVYCRATGIPPTVGNLRVEYAPVIIDKKLIQAVFYTGEKLFVYGDRCPVADKILGAKRK
jgi:hypothetical protein